VNVRYLFVYVVRPRALAVAEKLWSSKETTDLTDAGARIWEHRCRYLRYLTVIWLDKCQSFIIPLPRVVPWAELLVAPF